MSTEQGSEQESPFSDVRHPKKRAFLVAYAATGHRGKAAEAAGIERSTLYSPPWRDDEVFQAALERAQSMTVDILEEEALRRAVKGVKKPTGWYKGRPGGFVREYSDTLLIFLLKGAAPEKYKDRIGMDVRGMLGRIDWGRLSADQLQRIANGEHPSSVLAGAAEDYRKLLEQLPNDAAAGPKPLPPGREIPAHPTEPRPATSPAPLADLPTDDEGVT